MTQNFESPAELHADHRRWDSEISFWKDEISLWKKELGTALSELESMTSMIREHDIALDSHDRKLEGIESGLQYHEKNLAKSMSDHVNVDFDNALLQRHSDEAEKVAAQRDAHERIKRHQHIVMAKFAALKSGLGQAV